MGGGGSQERAEKEREDSALKREIREKKLKEERLALKRAEEKSEAASARRREIREKELKEECLALKEDDFWHHHIIFRRQLLLHDHIISRSESMMPMELPPPVKRPDPPSSSKFSAEEMRAASPASSSESMKSARSMDLPGSFKGAEEEREAAAAKRREIREKELKEERLALKRKDLWRHEPGSISSSRPFSSLEEERAGSPASSSVSMKSARSMDFPFSFKQPEMVMSMHSDQPMGLPPPVKLPDPPSRWNLWSHEPGPIISYRQLLWVGVGISIIFRQLLWVGVGISIIFSSLIILFTMSGGGEAVRSLKLEANERQLLLVGVLTSISPSERCFSLEEEEAGSPAWSCESMKSARSMDFPLFFKRSEEEREDAALEPEIRKMQLHLRRHHNLSRSKSNPEMMRKGSPASSCESMKSARSMGLPVSFNQDPGINAGPWTDLDGPGRTGTDRDGPGLHIHALLK